MLSTFINYFYEKKDEEKIFRNEIDDAVSIIESEASEATEGSRGSQVSEAEIIHPIERNIINIVHENKKTNQFSYDLKNYVFPQKKVQNSHKIRFIRQNIKSRSSQFVKRK